MKLELAPIAITPTEAIGEVIAEDVRDPFGDKVLFCAGCVMGKHEAAFLEGEYVDRVYVYRLWKTENDEHRMMAVEGK